MDIDVGTGRRSRHRAGESGRYAIAAEKVLFLSSAKSWYVVEGEEPQSLRQFVREMTSCLQTHLRPRMGPTPVDAGLERKFNSLVAQWKPAVEAMSSVTTMVLHPAYQQIIALGPRAIPLLLRELDRELDHWFWALRVLTGENPVPTGIRGNMAAMREAWLAWGRSKGHRW